MKSEFKEEVGEPTISLAIGDKVKKKYWDIIGVVIEIDPEKMSKKDKDNCNNPSDFVKVRYPAPTGLEWTSKNILSLER